MGWDSPVSIATSYGLEGGGDNFCTHPDWPWAHSASYTKGTVSFPGVNQGGPGTEHPHLSSAEVKERVELYFHFLFGPSWPVLG